MREIYTYANPLTINKDKLIWEMVNNYPQFCASDTLSQGMIQYYGRNEFGIIQTVSDLQKALVGDITNDAQFDMQLFLDISHEVRKLSSNVEIQKSFRSNLNEIVNSVRYLLLLDANPDKLLAIEEAEPEQIELFNIYSDIYIKYNDKITDILSKKKNIVEQSIRNTVVNEAEYVIKLNLDCLIEKDYHCKSLDSAKEKLQSIKGTIQGRVEGRYKVEYLNTSKEKGKLSRVNYLLDLIDRIDSLDVSTVIIHGVHKFTPEILLTISVLEKYGINVIFLIHYVEGLPQVYGTWREVYSWMNLDFKNVKPFELMVGSPTGREIAKILSGGLSTERLNSYKAEYDNLSSFAVGEIRQTFRQASEKLSHMKIQYYAVNNKDTNAILRNYFPEQFEVKPFLSYPIGQFILGLYNMWDFDSSCMRLNPDCLRECVVSGVFEGEIGKNISEVYDDIIPYIENVEFVNDVKNRLNHLKNERVFIEKNAGLAGLKAICYFSRDIQDIDRFLLYIDLLNDLSNQIFTREKGQISFNNHFKNLMEVLSEPFNNATIIHKAEIQLAQEILGVLGEYQGSDIRGDFSDVKEALAFFLHQTNNDDSSNWIVRNFEQLDGAVLLADSSKAREYHFALMSMKNMTRNGMDELPWPLKEELFYGYDCSLESSIQASALSNKERSNFLKYSLFYGTFFFKKKITFSYVVNQDEERQRAYYLFDLLKLKETPKEENEDVNFVNSEKEFEDRDFDFNSLSVEHREMFAICKYKYFLNRVLNEPIVYRNEFQIKYFLTNYIVQVVMDNPKLTSQNQGQLISKYIKRFSEMFPNYDVVAFGDIERKVKLDVAKAIVYSSTHQTPQRQSEQYKRRKRNFLLAMWEDSMNFGNISQRDVIDYMLDDNILLSVENRPHVKVCENCNYYADCLMKYYDGLLLRESED